MTVEEVLANEREEAAILRARGLADRADDIERVCDRVAQALDVYLRWLSETEASLWSGRSPDYLRQRFAGMAADGNARKQGRSRFYRASALPRTADIAALKRQARLDAEAA